GPKLLLARILQPFYIFWTSDNIANESSHSDCVDSLSKNVSTIPRIMKIVKICCNQSFTRVNDGFL
ncbi:38526_t:CDS:1, partial [Gigaspora margarita]